MANNKIEEAIDYNAQFTLSVGTLEWERTEGLLYPDDISLPCPVCGGTFSHILQAGTENNPAGDETGDTPYPGTSLLFERMNGYRRSGLRVDIDGECGHSWSLVIQQDKGQLFFLCRLRRSTGHDPQRLKY